MAVAQREVQKIARKARSQKGSTKERPRGNKVSQPQQIKKSRKKSGFMDTVFPFLIFMVTLVFFLSFAGIINLPFLKPIMPVKPEEANSVGTVKENPVAPEKVLDGEIYPGPDLPRVNQVEEEQSVSRKAEEPLPVPEEVEDEVMPGAVEDSASSKEEESLWRLAKIYAAMEPEEAARLLEKLSDEEVIRIFSVMKERNVAEILSIFPPERAAALIRKMMEGR